MHDQSCHVPSSAGHTAKSTGCCFGSVYASRFGSLATVHHSPSMTGIFTDAACKPDIATRTPTRTAAVFMKLTLASSKQFCDDEMDRRRFYKHVVSGARTVRSDDVADGAARRPYLDIAWPAIQPVVQAAWKLKPPVMPSMSSNSP